jgi:hypothetical protein
MVWTAGILALKKDHNYHGWASTTVFVPAEFDIDIDICYFDIGNKFVRQKTFIPIYEEP